MIDFVFPRYGEQRRHARAMIALAYNTEPKRRRIISPGLELTEPRYIDVTAFTSAHFTNCDRPTHQQAMQQTTTEHSNSKPITPPKGEKGRYFNPYDPMARE
jgi:hypothetical protein